MPIRFRCRFCNQLMGIARRKAGTTVQCPTCRAFVEVPHTDSAPPPEAPAPQPPALGADMPPLFERSDFDALLHNPVTESPPPRAVPQPLHQPPPPAVSFTEAPFAAPPSLAPADAPPPPGLLLSPAQATWLTVAAILLLALAFGAGLLVGHYWMG